MHDSVYFLAILNLGNEGFGRLKARDIVFIDDDRRVFRDVPGYFPGSFLVHERSKTPYINIVPVRHGIFHYLEKRLNRRLNIRFLNTCLLSDF